MNEEVWAFVGLGSNVGQREAYLAAAIEGLRATHSAAPFVLSPFYESAPVGGPPQPDYLNAVIGFRTDWKPLALLKHLQELEAREGRTRAVRWGPRTLDLDLLLVGGHIHDGELLTLPHPRMHLRRFVLLPLEGIAPEAIHPVLGQSVGTLLRACPDASAVLPYEPRSDRLLNSCAKVKTIE